MQIFKNTVSYRYRLFENIDIITWYQALPLPAYHVTKPGIAHNLVPGMTALLTGTHT